MKTLTAIYTFSFLFAAQLALADANMSSMQEFYDEGARMCRQKPRDPKQAAYAAAAADPAAWLLSLAARPEKTMLASCCTQKKDDTQASAR